MAKKTAADFDKEIAELEARIKEKKEQRQKASEAERLKQRADQFRKLEALAKKKGVSIDDFLAGADGPAPAAAKDKNLERLEAAAKKYGCSVDALLSHIESDRQVEFFKKYHGGISTEK